MGDFVRGLQATGKELRIFIVIGVDMKTEIAPICHIAVILIGNDGTLMYVHHKTVLWDYELVSSQPAQKKSKSSQPQSAN
jgi:predicted amidohydrolase